MSVKCPICKGDISPNDSVCPSCGFKIKGDTTRFEPIMVTQNASEDVSTSEGATLTVVRGNQIGISYPLNKSQITLGRNPQCDIFLNDMTVSRLHATIFCDKGTHIISDEHSFNGIWVNNENVEAKALKKGDFIQIGSFGFIYD